MFTKIKDIIEMNTVDVVDYFKGTWLHFKVGVRWIFLSVIIGCLVGIFSSAFAEVLHFVTEYRGEHPQLLYFLPLAGLVIVALYRGAGMKHDKGTNVLFDAVHDKYSNVPAIMAPLIFVTTAITHLFGGSAGREGAALQMGGSLGNTIAKIFRQKEQNRKILVMSGMSAAFSAVFGTPLAAAIFPLEMVNVGMFQYAALVPCAFSSIVAARFARTMGISPESFRIRVVPGMTWLAIGKMALLGLLCAWVSILFIAILRFIHAVYADYIRNPYIRVVVGGVIVVGLTLISGSMIYNGAGSNLIEMAIEEGETPTFAFLIKMVFTALTLGAGYKGGEIVPAFTAGATFGCLYGHIVGMSPSLCAAMGMIAVFCGVTNCPITSLLIGFELFGFSGVKYLLIAVSMSFLFSGYMSLYKKQVVVYSKYHTKYINDVEALDPLWKEEKED